MMTRSLSPSRPYSNRRAWWLLAGTLLLVALFLGGPFLIRWHMPQQRAEGRVSRRFYRPSYWYVPHRGGGTVLPDDGSHGTPFDPGFRVPASYALEVQTPNGTWVRARVKASLYQRLQVGDRADIVWQTQRLGFAPVFDHFEIPSAQRSP
jgi:hypothetical protein